MMIITCAATIYDHVTSPYPLPHLHNWAHHQRESYPLFSSRKFSVHCFTILSLYCVSLWRLVLQAGGGKSEAICRQCSIVYFLFGRLPGNWSFIVCYFSLGACREVLFNLPTVLMGLSFCWVFCAKVVELSQCEWKCFNEWDLVFLNFSSLSV